MNQHASWNNLSSFRLASLETSPHWAAAAPRQVQVNAEHDPPVTWPAQLLQTPHSVHENSNITPRVTSR